MPSTMDIMRALLAGGKGRLQGKEFARQLRAQYSQREYENLLKAENLQRAQELAASQMATQEAQRTLFGQQAEMGALGLRDYQSPQDIAASQTLAAEFKRLQEATAMGRVLSIPGIEGQMPVSQIETAMGEQIATGQVPPGVSFEYGDISFKAPTAQTETEKAMEGAKLFAAQLKNSVDWVRFMALPKEMELEYATAYAEWEEAVASADIVEAEAGLAPSMVATELSNKQQDVINKGARLALIIEQTLLTEDKRKLLLPAQVTALENLVDFYRPGMLELGGIRAGAAETSAAASMISATRPRKAPATPREAAIQRGEDIISEVAKGNQTGDWAAREIMFRMKDLSIKDRKQLVERVHDAWKSYNAKRARTKTGALPDDPYSVTGSYQR